MVRIPDFRYHRPGGVEEACRLLEAGEGAMVLAGGTDLLVDLKRGTRRAQEIVSLAGIDELRAIGQEDGRLTIGAAVTHQQLAVSDLLAAHWPALGEAAATIATAQIRNTATVGGNLCTAASCSDTAPVLIALEAEVELTSARGKRRLALQEFILDHRKTALEPGEILTRILVPSPVDGEAASYRKFGLRAAASIGVASVAARVRVAEEACVAARLVLGAVAPTPKPSPAAAERVAGRPLADLLADQDLLERAGLAAAAAAEPIDDLRGTADFRRELVAVLTRRALLAALERAAGRGGKARPGPLPAAGGAP